MVAGGDRPRVVIAGGGVAGIEALLALRDLAGDRVEIAIIARSASSSIGRLRSPVLSTSASRRGSTSAKSRVFWTRGIIWRPSLTSPSKRVWRQRETATRSPTTRS